MIRRLLLLIALVFVVVWALRRAVGTGSPSRDAPRGKALDDRGELVRDRVCNTYLPRSRALRSRVGSDEHFFCSEACRRTFLEQHPTSGSA